VRIVSEKALREFAAKHSDASAALAIWKTIVRRADWKSSADVKATFSDSDRVGETTVFNIALNRYRLIAFIGFRGRKVFIKAILTHKEYEKGEWKK
jgi:mRNA interferase HigB